MLLMFLELLGLLFGADSFETGRMLVDEVCSGDGFLDASAIICGCFILVFEWFEGTFSGFRSVIVGVRFGIPVFVATVEPDGLSFLKPNFDPFLGVEGFRLEL